MKFPLLSKSTFLSIAAAIAFTGSAQAVDSSAGSGEIAIYTQAAAGPGIAENGSVSSGFISHGFDNNLRQDPGSFSRSGADVTLSRSGYYLAIYNSQFDSTSGANRSEIQSYLTLGGSPLPNGWSQGYIRRAGAADQEAVTSGMAVFNADATDVLNLRSFRTDDNGAGVQRAANGTALQLIKLDDVHMSYAELSLSSNSTGPNSTTYLTVPYDTDTLGSGFTHGTPGELTLIDAGKYLVTANTYATGPGNRTTLTQRLTLDGSEVTGSKTVVYLRGSGAQNSNSGAAGIGMIIDVSAGAVLRVQGAMGDGDETTNYVGERCGLSVVKLPATAGIPAVAPEYIRLSKNTDQDVNAASDEAITFSTQEEPPSSAFSHTLNGSAVTVNTAGDYLFFGSVYDDLDQVQRAIYNQGWSVDAAARAIYGQTARYTRSADDGSGVGRQFGNASGFVGNALAANATVEMVSRGIGVSGTNNANRFALQGVRLSSLFTFDLYAVDQSVALVMVDEAGPTTDTYDMNLRSSPTGAVEVTVTADADTEVSSDGSSFGSTAVFTFTDTTPQTVHVRAIDDGDIEGSESATLTHAVTSSADPNFPTSLVINDVSALVTDNDVIPVVAIDDTATSNAPEDFISTESLLAPQATLLANDTDGVNNTVSGFSATSALGATVDILSDGTFTYDPSGAAGIQALAAGETAQDTFTYTVQDGSGNSDSATVTLSIDGANDDSVTLGEMIRTAGSAGLNLLSNDTDPDTNDLLTVSNFDGGVVPTTESLGTPDSLVFVSAQGATVTVFADGTISYDSSTSSAILSLADGATLSETFSYDVFDGTGTVSSSIMITSVGAVGATDDLAAVNANATVNFNALANDSVYGGAAGAAITGSDIEFVQGTAGNIDGTWVNSSGVAGTIASLTMDAAGTGSILDAAISNPPLGFSSAYLLDGTGGAAHASYENAGLGDLDTINPSFEVWFRPSDQSGTEVLWEGGGNGNGTSLVLKDGLIIFTESDGVPDLAQASAPLPAGAVANGEFVHVVGQIELDTEMIRLYVNGLLADERSAVNINTGAIPDLTDLAGSDAGGLGRSNGTIAGENAGANIYGVINTGGYGRFTGELAVARAYSNILSASAVMENYKAGVGSTVTAAAVGDVIELNGNISLLAGTTVETLASGATVKFESDGTFTYDPNSSFDDLAIGLTAIDTFTYRIGTHSNSLATARVTVTGTNTDPQITIAADQTNVTEGATASFTISASAAVSGPVTVNLTYSGIAGSSTDYTAGAASVVIPDTGSSAPLDLASLADGIFEGISENIIVTIDSIAGTATLGASLAAETFVDDADSPPEFSIAADSGSYTEGVSADFTISTTSGYEQDIVLGLSYSGTTLIEDFVGFTSVTLPASAAPTANLSLDLALHLINDGISDNGEVLTVTIDSVSFGTIATASDSTTVNDGAGASTLFMADFDSVTVGTNPDPLTTGLNAPAAANAGTAVGIWENMMTADVAGEDPGVYVESSDDADRADGIDNCLVLDRPEAGTGEVTAKFSSPLNFSGSNTGVICFDAALRRTLSEVGATSKNVYFRGYDEAGQKSFEFYIDANDSSPTDGQIVSVDSGALETPVGALNEFANEGQDERETDFHNVKLVLSASGYTISIDRTLNGIFEASSSTLGYAGPATQVSEIRIEVTDNVDGNLSAGIMLDEIKATGIAGNEAPSLSLDAVLLADAGSTALQSMVAEATKTLGSADSTEIQINDPDATGLTVRFQAGLGTISVSPQGSATAPASGTDDVLLSGSVSDVNSTLAAGVNYVAGVTGGLETLTITVDDGGSSGAGGAKSSTHDLTFMIFEDPLVTINQASGQLDPAFSGAVNFEVIFSEDVENFSDPADVVLSGTAGATTASITGGPATYNVAVTGMTGTGTVIAEIPADAAQRIGTADGNEPSISTDNVVTYILNVPPVAANIDQLNFTAVSTPGTVIPLGDIVISDGNNLFESTIAAASNPLFSYDGGTNITTFDGGTPADTGPSFSVPDPADADGFSFEMTFTPVAADVAVGGAGFENGVVVFETGGNSNGAGIFLIEGDLVFVAKMNGGGTDEPTVPLSDTDWGGNTVGVEILSSVPADEELTLAFIFDLDSVRYSVNNEAEVTVPLTNRAGRTNWGGDNSLNIGKTSTNAGGIGQASPTYWDEAFFDASLTNNVTSFRFWNGSGSAFSFDDFEEVTVTLTIDSYVDDATSGTLSASSGNSETYSAGVWTITGMLTEVNAALAAVEYTLGTAAPPVSISVSVEDGNEDGGGALTGTILIDDSQPLVVYVDDDFSGAFLSTIPDADNGTPSDSAVFGQSAFTNVTEALAAVDPTGTIVVNGGDYSTEDIALTGTTTLRLTDASESVSIGSLGAEATNMLNIQNSGLTLGATGEDAIIDCPIAGTSGTLAKTGAGDVRLRAASTFTGVTTINDGRIVITYIDASNRGSLASTGITVTSPGTLALAAIVDTNYAHSNPISGTGSVTSFDNGTVTFSTPGGNSFSGGFDLGDGGLSSFDGASGGKEGFVVLNHSDDLGSGKILSRGGQLQAGSIDVVIPNDIDITAGGFRNGGSIDFSFSGAIATIDASLRGFGNYGLEGLDLTITGPVDNTLGGDISFEGSLGKDNGTWTITGDISGNSGVTMANNFSDGEVTLSGSNNTYAGATTVQAGTLFFSGEHNGGGAYTVNSGATLAGEFGETNSAVTVDAGGVLNPGSGPGTTSALAIGDLTINGTLVVDINDTSTNYDQVSVTGTVTLGAGAILDPQFAAGLTSAATLTIVSNDDGPDAVTGVFTGFAEGVAVDANALGWNGSVTYLGGTGNDIEIAFGGLTIIGDWRTTFFGSSANSGDGADGNDANGNGNPNLLDFAFGFDPIGASSSGSSLVIDNPGASGTITTFGGLTVVEDPANGVVSLRYPRRADFAAAGLSYDELFSADLTNFEMVVGTVDIIATGTGDNGVSVEVVEVEFPSLLPSNGRKARQAKVSATAP